MKSTSPISPLFDILPNICNEEFRKKVIDDFSNVRYTVYDTGSYIDYEPSAIDISHHVEQNNCDHTYIVINSDGDVTIYYTILDSSKDEEMHLTVNSGVEDLFMLSTVHDMKGLDIEDVKLIKEVWSFYYDRPQPSTD